MDKKIIQTLFSCFLIFSLFVFCNCSNPSEAKRIENTKEKDSLPVEVVKVTSGDISAYISGTATLEAEDEAIVVTKVAEVVEDIVVEEGDKVARGQVLAVLDDDKLSLELEQAQAMLKKLKTDYNRNKELFSKKIISQENYEQAKSNYDMQLAQVNMATLMKGYTKIRAPISGIVTERKIKRGNMVALNQSCFKISDFDPLHALLFIPEKELSKLKSGQRVIISVDSIKQKEFEGTILRISPIVDSTSGTFKVTVEVKEKNGRLKPGMFARIRIIYDVHKNTTMVPKDAVLSEGNESIVFRVDNNTAYRTVIKTGYVNTTHLEVLTGLKLNDIIVRTGIGGLKDGTSVEILKN